ncbi:MAG: FecR domain-containing protein [Chitinophagaceae bacterium]|nr:FecR domain-containing protein [Chitinophagaceae bacterium]
MDSNRAQELLLRYIQQVASQDEIAELMDLAADANQQHLLKEAIANLWDRWPSTQMLSSEQSARLFGNIEKTTSPRIIRMKWMPWAAAACAIGIAFAIWLLPGKKTTQQPVTVARSHPVDVKPPAASHAMLTLEDGTQVPLDSMINGATYGSANVAISGRGDHEIKYAATTKVGTNTLSNPIGSRVVTLVLADGSKLWLNSGSSVTYPTAFTGNNRKVSMSGEVYFEVAKDRNKPFTVDAKTSSITVLGTHFNVSAYEEDALNRTTLLEGSVKVSHNKSEQLLKPGQQSEISNTGLKLVNDVDLEATMAWKNGFMSFRSADIPSILRQIQRWYGVGLQYPENMPRRTFTGDLSRDLTLNQVLKLLEASKIHFKLENNVLTVLP